MTLTAYLSVSIVQQKQSLFSETPKLNERLQRHSQAAELGHSGEGAGGMSDLCFRVNKCYGNKLLF